MNHLGSGASKHRHSGDTWWKLFRSALLSGSDSRRVACFKPCLSIQLGAELVGSVNSKMEKSGLEKKRRGEGRGEEGRKDEGRENLLSG